MNIATTDKIEFETFNKPDTVVNTEKLFGTKCPFSVPAFSKPNKMEVLESSEQEKQNERVFH